MISNLLLSLFGRRVASWYVVFRTRWFIERAVNVMALAGFGPDGVEEVMLLLAQSSKSVLTAHDIPAITAEVGVRRYISSGKGKPDTDSWQIPFCPGYRQLLENIGSRFEEKAA